ncbi:MAG: SusC/RagA family TonB-linked outer membrane protein [Prevotellaceae bacterium]|jgi:TonB-linked SusC/RagA family outer membrane protein|nr:SusC/RagA family TonB-linked outer membrane protein [Prevotellaceae bacterium]
MMKRTIMFALLMIAGLSWASAQTRITGRVIDAEEKNGLPGVSVTVKGGSVVATTDPDGKYAINAPQGAILIFSFVGMETQEIPVGNKQEINVVMVGSLLLEEVVVTGMTTTDKRLFTGSADKLTAERVKLDGIHDISRALEGRSAGVSVQNVSGTFGTAPKIRIRGATSIYGNSKPLWVLDGVIIEDATDISADDLSSGDAVTLIGNAIAGLNADDIESFEILKDGSATSIYGAKAMAGVIVITTKRGKSGSSRINYTGEFTTRLKPNYRNFNIMNSQDQMGIYKELEEKGWLNYASVFRASQSGVYGQMYRLMDEYDRTSGLFGMENTPEARNAFLQKAEMRNTDWFDQLFSNAIMMNHSVSISSGTDKTNSYVSMSVLTDPGWHKRGEVNRYTLNANTQHKIIDELTISLIGSGSYRKQFAPGTLAQNNDAVSGSVSRDFDINPYSYALNTSRTMGPDDTFIRNYAEFNIFQELEQNYLELDLIDAKFQAELKWNILPGWEAGTLGALKYASSSQQHHIKDNSNYARAFRAMNDPVVRDNNPWLYKDPDVPNSVKISILESGGFLEKREYKMTSVDFRFHTKYKKIFAKKHGIDFYGGMELNSIHRTNDWFKGVGMQYENGEIPFSNYLAFKKYQEQNTPYFSLNNTTSRSAAFFGTFTYSYKNKYSLNGTIRYEGSNRLGESRQARWLPTWNVSGAWNVHDEKFFDAVKSVLSHLKIRSSYSLTAQSGPSWVSNSMAQIYSYSPWRPFATVGESGLEIRELENSELTYEKQHEYDLGIDVGFLDNRINVVFDYYNRKMFDLIGYVTTMGVGGTINKMANTADMEAHGIELTLSTKNINGKNFKWATDFTFSYNKSIITELKTMDNMMRLITGKGFPMKGYNRSSLFSVPFSGLDNEGFPTFMWSDGLAINKGNYSDLDFQQRENLDFLKYEGTVEPTVTGGFGNIFSYKNLKLNVFITYSFGNKIRLDPAFRSSYSDMDASSKDFINRWVQAGDELYTNVPVIASSRQNQQHSRLNYGYNAYNYSDVRVADGGFVRMKEISVSYDFSKSLISKWKMQNLSLKLQVTNPFLIYSDSKLNGQDPEFFRSGGVAVPMSQQYTLTVRLGF